MSRIITFYSYKGGVGRTFALANIAVLLAKSGKRVLIMDWDLEAPGLHHYFKPYFSEGSPPNQGIIHLLSEAIVNKEISWKSYITEIKIKEKTTIYLISSGDKSADYVDLIRAFSWSNFFEKQEGGLVLERWRMEWKQAFDFVLIDSRTGITDTGGVCTVFFPDILMLVFSTNEQSFKRGIQVANGIQESRRKLEVPRPPLTIFPLLSRFDGRDEIDDSEIWLSRFCHDLKIFYDDWLHKKFEPRQILELTKIPYVTKFSFGEPLPVLSHSLTDPELPGFYISNIVSLITTDFQKASQIINPEANIICSENENTEEFILENEILAYKKRADSLQVSLPLDGFVTKLKVPVKIEDIYIPLKAVLNLRGVGGDFYSGASQAEFELRKSGAALDIDLIKVFRQCAERNRRGAVILGDPGAGKTTFLKKLLLSCLHEGSESIGLPPNMLPVFLALGNLVDLKQGLGKFIQDQLDREKLNTFSDFGSRLLKRGNLLLLLDGLDEVAHLPQKKDVTEWIEQSLRLHPTCFFVVTSRFSGYTPDMHLGADFLEMHIRPLSEEQIVDFVQKWYRVVEVGLAKDPVQAMKIAQLKADQLINRLSRSDFRTRRVFGLTRNPVHLTNICLMDWHRGELPQKRARYYEECIDVLLERMISEKGLPIGMTAQECRQVLQPAALWLHGQPGRTRATAAELAPHIEPVLKSVGCVRGNAEEFLRTIRDQSGLLTGYGVDQYGFIHLGFQEYLAAREISSRAFEDPTVLRELAHHYGESWWQEVTLLLLALEGKSLFVPFIREVVRQAAFADYPAMVEMCIDDSAEISTQPFLELVEADPGNNKDLWQRQFLALKVLARIDKDQVGAIQAKLAEHPFEELRQWLSDRANKPGHEVVYALHGGYELVRIPAGAFLMGSPSFEKDSYSDESPVHEVRVPEFFMGRYPVTNEEYGRFLKDNPKINPPDYWDNEKFNKPRQPVVGVSWDDAQRYAFWAGLRLPSEAEWEYACRAGTSSRFYTGDSEKDLDQAGWYGENSEMQTHSVGEKAPNVWGLYDMHGNVQEWVEDDRHENYNGAPHDGSAWIDKPRGHYRIVRGGKWDVSAEYCQSTTRRSFRPGDRYDGVGFRLARSVAIGA
jgi:formylglycine-generating enzyme required for sulfatase activity